jgi:N4-gp56 family major capsid protein
MAAATLSDGASISFLLPIYYKKKWLLRHEASLAYDEWGQQEPIPMGSGRTIEWHQMLNPAVGYQVGEGSVPAASAISARKVSAVLVQWADLKSISDYVDNNSICPVVDELVQALGYGGALTKDNFISDRIGYGSTFSTGYTFAASSNYLSVFSQGFPVYSATSDVLYWPNINGGAAVGLGNAEVGSFSTTPDISQIRAARTQLANLNAIPFDDGNYRGIISHTVSAKVRNDSLWPTWNAYSNRAGALTKGILGIIEGVLFKESQQAMSKTLTASAWSNSQTSGGGTLYGTLIFGMGAYGVTKLAGKDVTITTIPASKTDKSDPLGQIGMVGYKFDMAAHVLNPSAGLIWSWWKSAL